MRRENEIQSRVGAATGPMWLSYGDQVFDNHTRLCSPLRTHDTGDYLHRRCSENFELDAAKTPNNGKA